MDKVNFYLLNKKGYTVLDNFLNVFNEESIGYVVIGKDEDIEDDFSEAILELCIKNNINYFFRHDNIPKTNNFSFCIGWRWIINEQSKIIVFHDSLLPKYRGFSPLVNALINGEKSIGVTALLASEEYDKGDIILQKSIKIHYPIKISEAIDKVSLLYSELVIETFLNFVQNNNTIIKKQDDSLATYSLWRDKEDYYIDWNWEAEKIKRFIDAVGNPYEGAKAFILNKEIIIKQASLVPDVNIENRDVGKIIFMNKNIPVVVCSKGLIKIEEAVYSENGNSIFPLNKFRIRFK